MANAVYPLAKEHFGLGEIAWVADTIRVAMLDSSYTYSAADEFFTAVSSAVVGTPVDLASKTVSLGVFDAADISFTTVPDAITVSYLVIYKWTGSAATSALICYIDNATGLPFVGQGVAQGVSWDSNAGSKIFAWGDDC